jgi:hypothetical protein
LNTPPPKTFADLTERQQRAAYAFAKKYGAQVEDVAAHLDTFFQVAHGELTVAQAEAETGLTIFDRTHPTLF